MEEKTRLCPHCGKCLSKKKLTLSVNAELVEKAKQMGINISEFLEGKLREVV